MASANGCGDFFLWGGGVDWLLGGLQDLNLKDLKSCTWQSFQLLKPLWSCDVKTEQFPLCYLFVFTAFKLSKNKKTSLLFASKKALGINAL